MKILFNVEFQTAFGESLVLNILPAEEGGKLSQYKMTTIDGTHWFVEVTKNPKPSTFIDYYYSLMHGDEEARHEWLVEPHRLEFAAEKAARYTIYDHWIDIPEDAYMYSSALTDCIMVNQREMSAPTEFQRTVRLKVTRPCRCSNTSIMSGLSALMRINYPNPSSLNLSCWLSTSLSGSRVATVPLT